MSYNLLIDDIRTLDSIEVIESGVDICLPWCIVRSVDAAIKVVEQRGMPKRLALDHDLGINSIGKTETTMDFLYWLTYTFWDGEQAPPEYTIHSMNPVGRQNITSLMETWRKSNVT